MSRRNVWMSVIVPLFAVALGAGACGGSDEPEVPSANGSESPATTGAGDDAVPDAQAFTECMRDHGVEMEDPDPATGLPVLDTEVVDPSSDVYKSAMQACQDLLPDGTVREPADQEELDKLQEYAECMRANGLPDFPDPQPGENGIFGSDAVDRNSPVFQAASEACQDTLAGIVDGGGQ